MLCEPYLLHGYYSLVINLLSMRFTNVLVFPYKHQRLTLCSHSLPTWCNRQGVAETDVAITKFYCINGHTFSSLYYIALHVSA
jgi:hypothetical protein